MIILFLGIILLAGSYSVLAIQGVCTGTQTCFCSGNPVPCPCDADPCVICGPTSIECTGGQTGNQQTQTAAQGTESSHTNPQTPGDFLGLIGDGIANLVRTAFGQPSVVGGKAETSRPTMTEMMLAIIALAAIFAGVIAILKAILAKIAMSKTGIPASAGMSRAQPSRLSPRKVQRPGKKYYNPKYRY